MGVFRIGRQGENSISLSQSNSRRGAVIILGALLTVAIGVSGARADVVAESPTTNSAATSRSTRYGLFNLLDSRSAYGQGVFPEPFLVDDSDGESNEARLDWFHAEGPDQGSDVVTAEVEKGFGPLTLELEVPYEIDHSLDIDPDTGLGTGSRAQGFANINPGARVPVYQFVSENGVVDNSIGVAIEVGIPTNSPVSKNTEVVPKIFDDLKLGDHFTIQTIEGYSQLFGGGDDSNLETLEYGVVLGYSIEHTQLPIPCVEELIPVFEMQGGTELNKDQPGHTSLLGNAAIRLNMDNVGPIQPRLGIGYVFPMNDGAREDLHWGIYTSLVFEY
jgi:hypothetical protein